MDFVHKVQQVIKKHNLLVPGDTIIVAVSGGPDSVALLHILKDLSVDWRLELIVCHVNHQFRREESNHEANQVKRLAKQLGLSCEIGVFDVPQYQKQHGMNAQVAARNVRYLYLHQIADKYQANKIALGHHADDQAETILMRMVRGTGPAGLLGIPLQRTENNVELIRPLLSIYKSEILSYCDQHNVMYCEDSSNTDRKYTRNQMRVDVIPYLKQWNPKLPQALNKLGIMMRDEDDYMNEQTQKWFEQYVTKTGGDYYFTRHSFLSLAFALQRRLIKLILSYLSSDFDDQDYTKVELIRTAMEQSLTPSLQLHISQDICFLLEYDQVRIGSYLQHKGDDFLYLIEQVPSLQTIYEAGIKISFQVEDVKADKDKSYTKANNLDAFFDLDLVALPIKIRSRHPGDRIQLMGLEGSKKVKNLFIDEKIPPSRRTIIPIIVDANDEILWVAGFRQAALAKITQNTLRILHMKQIGFI